MRPSWGIVLLVGSLAVTAILFAMGIPVFLLFFALPLLGIPWLRGGRRPRPPAPTCPRCRYQARGPDEAFCPRDGAPLAAAPP